MNVDSEKKWIRNPQTIKMSRVTYLPLQAQYQFVELPKRKGLQLLECSIKTSYDFWIITNSKHPAVSEPAIHTLLFFCTTFTTHLCKAAPTKLTVIQSKNRCFFEKC